MADIKIEKKKSGLGWLWALLAILVLALIIWWIWAEAGDDDDLVEPEVGVVDVEPIDPAPIVAPTADADLAAILANPQTWVGRELPTGEYQVAEVTSDRGFWISENGNRLLALILDQPLEQPIDINPGQRLRIEGGTLRDASYLPQLGGATPLDDSTRQAVEAQPIYLVVDEDEIEILEGGEPQPGTDPALGADGNTG